MVSSVTEVTGDAPAKTTAVLTFPHVLCPDGVSVPVLVAVHTSAKRELEKRQLLHVSVRLGIPICWCAPSPEPELPPPLQSQATEYPTNPILEFLSLEKAPTIATLQAPLNSDKLFSATTLSGKPRPIILLARADGKELECGVVMAMWTFVTSVVRLATKEPNEAMAYARYDALINPETFAAYFEKFRGLEGKDGGPGPLGWEDLECPVNLGCNTCGKTDGSFSRCGKCGIARYCGRDCQTGDWATHKQICVKGRDRL